MTDITGIRLNKFELKHADVDDPVAAQVSWNPARGGGANFRTHVLKAEQGVISVERSKGLMVFGLAFMAMGMLPVGLAFVIDEGWGMRLFMMAFGSVFVAVGYATLRGKDLLTFDKTRGVYYRGKQYQPDPRASRDRQGRTSDIHAIQLISEIVSGSKGGSYTSYELNLVFKDGGRLNVMDHGDGEAIEGAAKQLAGYLNVPVWQAVY